MAFQNVSLSYQNVSAGPSSGRIYSIDHVSSTLISKTYPAGGGLLSYPLNAAINNEVIELEWDGYYFWTLSKIGLTGNLGVIINKWYLNGTTVEKQYGPSNEIILNNTSANTYAIESFCVHRYETTLTSTVNSGSTNIPIANSEFLRIGDSIYIGPNTSSNREERTVTNIIGNVVYFLQPLVYSYNLNNLVTYRRNIWTFNNRQGLSDYGGTLIQIDSYTGYIYHMSTSAEWRGVTAATSFNGNITFVRGSQLLQFKPFGSNRGYQISALLNNIKTDNNTLIKAYDIIIDSSKVYKLQTERREFNPVTGVYSDVPSTTGKYEIDEEILAAKVTSLTVKRNESIFFGASQEASFTVKVTDQYDFPVFNRSITVTEDDALGYIPTGYSSLLTNSNGECITKYNSGSATSDPNLKATLPKLKIKDSSNYFVENQLIQIKNEDSYTYLEQRAKKQTQIPVQQDKRIFSSYLQQTLLERVPETYLEQRKVDPISSYLDQRKTTVSGFLLQEPLRISTTYLQQDIPISSFTTLEQYSFLIFAIPTPYSIKNPPNTNILVRIKGFGSTPLNVSTLKFLVNGIDVTDSLIITLIGPDSLQIDYNPPVDFDYASTVTISIEIQDTNIPPRTISTYYTFDIVDDYKKPFLYQTYPPNNSINNNKLTEIYTIIKDLETGIDINSILMFVEGKPVIPIINIIDLNTVKVLYQTTEQFIYESDVIVGIFVSDNAGNDIFDSWSFSIEPSAGILFTNMNPALCGVLIPTDTNICTELFGLEDGINLDSVSFAVDGRKINYLIKPKVYIKE